MIEFHFKNNIYTSSSVVSAIENRYFIS